VVAIRREDITEDDIYRMKWEYFKKVGYDPSPGQREFHESRARFRVMAAGTRFGKSYAAAKEICPRLLLPGEQGWIVGPTYRLGEKEFRYVWEDLVINLKLPTARANNNLNLGDMYIEFPWGAWVRVMSAEKPANLLGEELDFVVLAEGSQIKEQVWTRYLRGRLVSRRGFMIANTTPNEQDGLIWPMFQKGQDRRIKEYWSGQYGSAEGKTVTAEEVEAVRQELIAQGREDEFREQYLGEFLVLGTKSIFHKDILQNMLEAAKDPVRICRVDTELSGDIQRPKLNWEMEDDEQGELEVFAEPRGSLHYAVGSDVAEEDTPQGDFTTAHVICLETGEEVAAWHGTISPGDWAQKVAAIGYYYNTAPVGIEYNNMGAATCNEIKKFYTHLYRRLKHDTKSPKMERKKAIGWYTSKKTKPILVSDLDKAIKAGELRFNSAQTIRELLSFGKDKNGRLKGLGSAHDDRVMGAGIAWQTALQFDMSPIDDDPVDYSDYDSLAGVA